MVAPSVTKQRSIELLNTILEIKNVWCWCEKTNWPKEHNRELSEKTHDYVEYRYTIKVGKEKTIQLLILEKVVIHIGWISPHPQTTKNNYEIKDINGKSKTWKLLEENIREYLYRHGVRNDS